MTSLPASRGRPGICQGSYGQAGNLELVVADAQDGFWVYWFNADPVEAFTGAACGQWSAGLHVGTGSRLDAVTINQVPFGPDFLEVTATSATTRQRWYWTPADGFCPGGGLPGYRARDRSAGIAVGIAASGGLLHTLGGAAADGSLQHFTAEPSGYPQVYWQAGAVLADGGVDLATAELHAGRGGCLVSWLDHTGLLHAREWREGGWSVAGDFGQHAWRKAQVLCAPDGPLVSVGLDQLGRLCTSAGAIGGEADSFTATVSSLLGGCLEIAARTGEGLRHDRYPLSGAPSSGAMIVSDVWVSDYADGATP